MSTRPGRASRFISLFILERDNNNKNNRLDLNGSKGKINIPSYIVFLFIFFALRQPHSPLRRFPCTVYLCAVFEAVLLG